MGRFLGRYADKARFMAICLVTASIVYGSLSFVSTARATTYSATVTGYAYGLYGAAGVRLEQYHFANHPPGTMCDGQRDWSGDWAWGTQITMSTPVSMRNATNTQYYRSVFYLEDNGDPNCVKGMNWVDIHFGRYRYPWWYGCSCSGTPNPVCDPGWNSVNNCQNAIDFGSSTRTYTK